MAQPNTTPHVEAEREHGTAESRAGLLHLAHTQRGTLATTFDELLGDGSPPDETADDMICAVRAWRDVPSNRKLD